MKRVCSWLLVLAMLLTMLPTAFASDARSKQEAGEAGTNTNAAASLGMKDAGAEVFDEKQECDPETEVSVIVLLDDSAIPDDGLPTKSARNQMRKEQAAVQKTISEKVLNGRELEISHSYTTLTNGFSATVTYGELEQIRELEGVEAAFIAPRFEIEPQMTNSNKMVGGGVYNETGYHGEGMVIAVLDTGIDLDHEIFADAPVNPKLTLADIQKALDENDMQCEAIISGIGASTLYYNEKIPFQFDYGDKDTDGNPTEGEGHGTHVAATAAGNDGVKEDFSGVAPEAQILNMNVFRSTGGAAYDDILAALEDCMILGVDAVNMSLGSVCGFIDYESQDEWTMNLISVFNRAGEHGLAMSVAVGNDYSAAYHNAYGGKALASNPDYGNAGEPSTYDEPLSIGAVENDGMVSPYIIVNGRNIAYYDGYDAETNEVTKDHKFRNLASFGSLEYVMIDGFGEAEDFAGLDLSGKIAVVARGGGVFYETKANNAAAAGAAGMIVYNNEPGMILMSISNWTIPIAFVSQQDGAYLAKQADKHLTIAKEDALVTSPTAGMCDFTCWGATSELTLKPELTAPGGNIYSAVPGNGTYELMSGTSMASPHVAGGMAIVAQALRERAENAALTDGELKDLVDTMLLSTATILYDGDTPFSPRRQGGGMMNVNAAAMSDGYITVPGMERPKMELGDDVARTGVYKLDFTVHNTGDETLYYKAEPIVLTDKTEEKNGDVLMTETDTALPHTFTTNFKDNIVAVPAGSKVEVEMTITLTNPEQTLAAFENGAFVEGWAVLKAVNADGTENEDKYDLNAPFLAFYGDWTQAPMIDSGFWWEEIAHEQTTAQTYPNEALLASMEGYMISYLGDNNYSIDVPYLADRNAISPNNDDFLDNLTYVYTGLLRSARNFTYTITGEDGTVYYEKTVEYEPKSVYNAKFLSIVPAGAITDYGDTIDPWFGTDETGSSLPNNTKATVTVSATPIYDAHESNNKRDSWSFPITVDTEAPEAVEMKVRESEGRYYATITVKDNQYVAAVVFSDSKYSKEFGVVGVGETEPGQTTVIENYDITGFGETIGVVVDDYAGNSKTYYLKATGNSDDYSDVVVTEDMVLYKEDFNTKWLPEGWTMESKSKARNTWYRDEYYWAAIDYDADFEQNEWLYSCAYDLSGQSTPTHMVFDFETSYTFCVQYPHFNVDVYITKDDGANWESIWNLRDSGLYADWTVTQAKVMIPDEYQGCDNVRFAFVYTGDTGGATYAFDNVTIYKDRAEDYVTVTATAGEGGSISPAGATLVKKGNSKTFTVTPNEGYQVESVVVDGKDLGPISYYTFDMVGIDHTISATFKQAAAEATYTINAETNVGGTITPSGKTTVAAGGSQTYTIAANDGYQLVSVRVNGRTVGCVDTYTFENVDQSYYILATFEAIPETPEVIFEQDFEDSKFPPDGWSIRGTSGDTWKRYSYYYLNKTQNAYISAASGAQNESLVSPTISLKGATGTNLEFDYAYPYYVLKDGDFTFTLQASVDGGSTWTTIWDAAETMPDSMSGYVVTDRAFVTIPEALCTDSVCFAWNFVSPAGAEYGIAAIDNIKLEATGVNTDIEGYAKILAAAGEGGIITPSGRVYAEEGTDTTFTITPMVGYEIADVIVDGESAGAVETYTFEAVTGSHTIEATFKLSSGKNGVFFENDFEDADFPTRGWTVKSTNVNDITWSKGKLNQLNSTYVALATADYDEWSADWSNGQKQDEMLISPTVDLTGAKPVLQFDYAFGRYELFTTRQNDLTVEVSTDGGTTWNVIWNAVTDLEIGSGMYQCGSAEVEIPAEYCVANLKVAFRYTKKSGAGDNAAIDNVKLSQNTEECVHAHTEVRNEVKATCTDAGYTGDTFCTDCGALLAVGNATTALGHDYVATVTEPTCTEKGYTTHTCSRCEDSYVDTYVDAKGHDWSDWTETVPATCDKDGKQTRTCNRCGETEEQTVKALGHDYVATVTEPTCTEKGYTTHTCSRCGDSFVDTYVDALGHKWDEGKVTTEPTETEAGVKTYTCERCGATKTEEIPASGDPSAKFTDVEAGKWYYEAVDFVVTNGLMKGISDTTFEPNSPMTRGMLVTILYRAEGEPDVAGIKHPFTDVAERRYFTKPVAWAYDNDIVKGITETTFEPDTKVSREQLATILFRYAEAEAVEEDHLKEFPDAAKVHNYAKTALNWAVAEGLITGNKNNGVVNLDPRESATRAQIATILMRYLQNTAE